MPIIVSFKQVSYSYDGYRVLEKTTFTIQKGSYIGIVGPNGSGKTTLIRLLVGLLKPTEGKITRYTQNISYIPQRIVQHDFSFPATVSEIVPNRALLQEVNLERYASRRIGDLSGGERQRVFIARALSRNPELLVLDEPTIGVDDTSQKQFYALLSKINKKKKCTIILVSHDLDVVARETQTILKWTH